MASIRGGHTNLSVSHEAMLSASAPQDSSQASQAPTVPSSEGGVPSSPPQRRYSTWRPPTSPPPEPSVCRIPPKRAKTSGLGEMSRHVQLDSQAPADSQRSSGIATEAIIKRPMVTATPIEGNSDYRARSFHSELYFDIEAIRQQPELRDSFGLLQRYHLECLMTPKEFFYPRVAIDFYQSMTTQGAQSPTTIHFSIDGRQGILEVRHIAEALHIPYQSDDPAHFRQWSLFLSETWSASYLGGTSGDSFLLRKELPSEMLLVDVLLRSNIFPLQHLVQRRGAILDTLFRISEGFYFEPHHLIMAALLYFEEKVHKKKLQRVDTIPLLFPRLLFHILEHMGYSTEPHLKHRHHCREHFTLDQWTLVGYSAPEAAPPTPAPSVSAQQDELPTESIPLSPAAPSMPEATPIDPSATPPVPQAAPPTSEAPITISPRSFVP